MPPSGSGQTGVSCNNYDTTHETIQPQEKTQARSPGDPCAEDRRYAGVLGEVPRYADQETQVVENGYFSICTPLLTSASGNSGAGISADSGCAAIFWEIPSGYANNA